MWSKWCPKAETIQKSPGSDSSGARWRSRSSPGAWGSVWWGVHGTQRPQRQQRHQRAAVPGRGLPCDTDANGFSLCTCLPSYQFCEHLLILPSLPNLTRVHFYCLQIRTPIGKKELTKDWISFSKNRKTKILRGMFIFQNIGKGKRKQSIAYKVEAVNPKKNKEV